MFEPRKNKKRISLYKGSEKKIASYGLLNKKQTPLVKDIKVSDLHHFFIWVLFRIFIIIFKTIYLKLENKLLIFSLKMMMIF